MNRRQKIIVSITGIFIVMLALVGLTYAYFLTRITGNENEKSISVTTANLVLEYQDGNGILETDKLKPSNDFINFKDSKGNLVPSKIFTVTNKGNATVERYKVYLEKVQNQLERKEDLVYTLSCKAYTNYGENNQTEIETGCNGVDSETTFPDLIISIATNDIEVGVTHKYELKAKYKEMGVDQSIDMNKLITAKINIYDASTKFLAREMMDNALSTEMTEYNKTIYIDPSLQDGTNYTIPAHATSLANERILTYTMDDYGTSYYFRGNVEDNYVNFADMCWRIVRIEGDGSVKLILEDYDQLCNSKDISGNLNMDGNWSDGNTYVFGYNYYEGPRYTYYLRLNYINYTGGLADSLKAFQTSKLSSKDLDNLKVDEWCYDDRLVGYNYITYTEFYGAYQRIIKNKKPSLKCYSTELTKFKDETDMYVGSLTADEISFAGAVSEYNNSIKNDNYYLINPYAKKSWWAISPSYWGGVGQSDYSFYLGSDALLDVGELNYGKYSRPALTLKSSIGIVKGIGTQGNPYVIN